MRTSQPSSVDLQQVLGMVTMQAILDNFGCERLKRGRCKCPLCNVTTRPAFSVNENKGTWFCFACNRGGGKLDLIAALQGGERKEAVATLSRLAGVEVSKDPGEMERIAAQRRAEAELGRWMDGLSDTLMRLAEGYRILARRAYRRADSLAGEDADAMRHMGIGMDAKADRIERFRGDLFCIDPDMRRYLCLEPRTPAEIGRAMLAVAQLRHKIDTRGLVALNNIEGLGLPDLRWAGTILAAYRETEKNYWERIWEQCKPALALFAAQATPTEWSATLENNLTCKN